MASLTGQLVAETYKALLKLIDNDILTTSEKQITDGFGGGSNVFIDSQGFLRANKYKITNGLATQFLKADGSLDSNAYLTSITGTQVITALGYTPVPTTRTITINGETHNLAADNSWTVGGTAAIWGNITGTLSNQTDLQNALNAKYNNPTGTISQYIRGDGSIANFPALTGYVPYSGATSNVNLGEYGITSGFVGFDTTPTGTPTGIGTLYWDSANRTLSLIDGDGDTTLQIGQEERVLVHNNTGATLTDGQIVYVTGSTGELPSVALASNSAEATSSVTFGMVTESIAHGADGFITTSGIVHGLNTLAFTEGAALWLGTTPGTFTQTKPVAPLNSVLVGYVIKKAGGNGSVFVKIQNGYELEELHDVYIADPANNHGLFYDIADGLWKNKSIASALGYTPQAQLSGTGFVKASGTTITYDNSTYLTTTDAASTYQRLDKMVSNLLPSATEYPNSNAVIAALALKADAANPVFTGNMTISGAEPKLYFTDTDQNPDYFIGVDAGFFRVYDQTAGATRFVINSDGNISTGVGKSITAGSFIKDGGTATQFLKADGSVDSTDYATVASLANYLLSATAASTYQTLANLSTDLTASATKYPSVNAVNTGLGTKQPLDADLTAIAGLTGTSGFLKKTAADTWTLDTNTYLTTGDASTTYLAITTAASTYQRLDKMVSNLLPSSTEYPNSNAVINALALKADAANPVFTGNMTISGATPRLYFVDTDQNPDYTVFIDSGYFYIYDQTAGATRFSINSSGNINTGVGKSITAGSFIKESGTSSQYLMADGSVSTLSGLVTGSGTTNYIPKWTSGSAVGNSIIYELNSKIHIGTTTESTYKLEINAGAAGGVSVSNSAAVLSLNLNNSTNNAIARFTSTTNAFWDLQANTDGTFQIDRSDVAVLTFATSGAATFSSSVTASSINAIGTLSGSSLNISGTQSTFRIASNYTGGGDLLSGTLMYIDDVTNNNLTIIPSSAGTSGSKIVAAAYTPGAWRSMWEFSNVSSGNPNLTLVKNGGNVLIGTTPDAGYKLDVAGISRFSTSGNNIAVFDSTNLNGGYITFRRSGNDFLYIGNSSAVGGGANFTDFYTTAGLAMRFFANGNATSAMTINTSNYVDIDGLRLKGTDSGNTIYVGNRNMAITAESGYNIGIGRSSDLTRSLNINTTNGNVGMNTTSFTEISFGSPILKLAGSRATIGLVSSGSLATIAMMAANNTSTAIHINHDSSGNTEIYNYAAAAVVVNIKSNGNFLIGTTTDNGTKLNINAGSASGINVANAAAVLSLSLGNSTNNTILRMTSSLNTFWDVQANTDGSFQIDRGDVVAVSFATSRAATFSSSVTATSFFESSDFRLKTLIESNPIIDGIENLQAKLYEKNGKIELGYFAQDAELIMPYAVTKNDEGFLNLSYREVHTAKIARLEQRVAELEKQLNLN